MQRPPTRIDDVLYVIRAPDTNGQAGIRPVSYAPGQTLEFGLATFGRAFLACREPLAEQGRHYIF